MRYHIEDRSPILHPIKQRKVFTPALRQVWRHRQKLVLFQGEAGG